MRGVAFLSFFFLPTIITLMAFFSNLPIWVVGSCAFFFWRHQRKNFLGGNFEGAQNWIVWMEIDFVGLAFWTFFLCEVWGQFVLQLLGMVHNSSLASSTVNCNHLLRRSLRPNIWQVGIPKYNNVLWETLKWTKKMDSKIDPLKWSLDYTVAKKTPASMLSPRDFFNTRSETASLWSLISSTCLGLYQHFKCPW